MFFSSLIISEKLLLIHRRLNICHFLFSSLQKVFLLIKNPNSIQITTVAFFVCSLLRPACLHVFIGMLRFSDCISRCSKLSLPAASNFSFSTQCLLTTWLQWLRHLSALLGLVMYCKGSGRPYLWHICLTRVPQPFRLFPYKVRLWIITSLTSSFCFLSKHKTIDIRKTCIVFVYHTNVNLFQLE